MIAHDELRKAGRRLYAVPATNALAARQIAERGVIARALLLRDMDGACQSGDEEVALHSQVESKIGAT